MKKILITAGCFFLSAIIALPVFVYYINQGKEKIVITEEVIEGDPAAARSIMMQTESTWNGNLFWETEYAIGAEKEAESHFTFYAGKIDWNQYLNCREACEIKNTLSYFYGAGYNGNGLDPEAVPVPDTVREMVRQARPREVEITAMSMKDCYDYWPVEVYLTSSSHEFYSYGAYGMAELFKIPVPEDAVMEITIQKDVDGRCNLLQCEAKSGCIDIESIGSFGPEGCYLSYYCVDAQTGSLRRPGEDYGIYYTSYPEGTEGIRNVYSLDKNCMPVAMEIDEDTGQLWVLIRQDGQYYLDLLSLKENGFCELVQQITIPDQEADKESFSQAHMNLTEDGLLITWPEESLFAFISDNPRDGYTLWCMERFPEAKGQTANAVFPYEQSLLFDGERLVLAAFSDWAGNDVQLAVFTKEGLAYHGLYRHSGEWDKENNFMGGWIQPMGRLYGASGRYLCHPLRLRFLSSYELPAPSSGDM